jgi:hypothetical protein
VGITTGLLGKHLANSHNLLNVPYSLTLVLDRTSHLTFTTV